MTYLALVGVQAGRRAGYAATLGVALGLGGCWPRHCPGLSARVAASPMLYSVLRWVGGAYLVYLASEAWGDSGSMSKASFEPDARFSVRGLITNFSTPRPQSSIFRSCRPSSIAAIPQRDRP